MRASICKHFVVHARDSVIAVRFVSGHIARLLHNPSILPAPAVNAYDTVLRLTGVIVDLIGWLKY